MIPVITIDGPAASGKGTVARLIANRLQWNYLDSGVIYRAVGFLIWQSGLAIPTALSTANTQNTTTVFDNEVLKLIDTMYLEFSGNDVILNGSDVTLQLRDEKIGEITSQIAALPRVRERLLDVQKSYRKLPGLITDGRDMGSTVFPDAILKIYLTATADARAVRRLAQLQQSGLSGTMASVLHKINSRDECDSKRATSPLKYDQSFKLLDNSAITIAETADTIIKWLDEIYECCCT